MGDLLDKYPVQKKKQPKNFNMKHLIFLIY